MQVDAVNSKIFFPYTAPAHSAYHVQDVAFDYVFTLFSPINLAKSLAVKSVSTIRTAISISCLYLTKLACDTIRMIHHIFKRLTSQFLLLGWVQRLALSFLNLFIYENAFDKKIAELQNDLKVKTGSSCYPECSKAIAKCLAQLCKTHILTATEIEPAVRPEWLSHLVQQDNPSAYNFSGKMACALLQKHEALFEKMLECNFLKFFSSLIDILLHKQGENGFALLDLVHKSLEIIPAHFYACQNLEEAKRKGEADSSDFMPSKELQEKYLKALLAAAIPLLAPQGAMTLELPVSKTIASYLSPYLYKNVQQEILPHALKELLELFEEKEKLLEKVLEAMHAMVDQVPSNQDSAAIESKYPRLPELNNTISECLLTVFEYFDPTFVPWILKQFSFAPQLVAKAAGMALSERFEHMSLLDALQIGCEKLLPILEKPIQLEKTTEEKQAMHLLRTAQRKKEQETIDRLVDTIGKEPLGLKLAIQKKFFIAQEDESSKTWMRKKYEGVTNWLLDSSFSMADVPTRINKLNKAFITKMKQPEHTLLLFDLVQKNIALLGGRAEFPPIRNARFKK